MRILVAPYWNLNSIIANNAIWSQAILVAPYWNLNLRVYKWDNVDTNDISSSILEFKYRRRFIKEIWDKILVAPYWNLNLFPTLKTPLYSIPY